MFKKIAGLFKKPRPQRSETTIELSKIDKHMNFILRDRLGSLNRMINDNIGQINTRKDLILHELRSFHKKTLMNPNIPAREINIMEGNRDNYIKRISHFLVNIEIPKNYMDTYGYCVKFSSQMENLSKEIQKNVFVLGNFFETEIRVINKELNKIEEIIIDIRVTLEKNNIEILNNVDQKIKEITKNLVRIKTLKSEILDHEGIKLTHKEKLDKLKERINTITSGTDYRALETFKKEKEEAQNAMKESLKEIENAFSELEHALKKYFYKNPDKKIIKSYTEDVESAIMHDHNLEIMDVLKDLKEYLDNNQVELKNHKKDKSMHAITKLNFEFLKNKQSELKKLEEAKQHAQAKITHNSASLNLSEQQYWINSTEDKISQHVASIEKLEKEIAKLRVYNEDLKEDIKDYLEKILGESIIIKDDIQEQFDNAELDKIGENNAQ